MSGYDDLLQIALNDADLRRRQAAVRELARLPEPDRAALFGPLAQALRHADALMQRRAAVVLGELGDRAAPCLPELLKVLTGPRWTVREAAAQTLGRVGHGQEMVRVALVHCALHDRSPLVREAALQALVQRHLDQPLAVSDFRQALAHPFPRVRCRALRGLTRLASQVPDLVALVTAALGDSHARVRRNAAELAGDVGANAMPILGALLRRRSDRDTRVRLAAERSWLRLGKVLPPLPAVLQGLFDVSVFEPEKVLKQVLGHAELPAAIRARFLALCERRARWYSTRSKAATPAAADPDVTVEEAVGRTLAAAANTAALHVSPHRSPDQVRALARREEAVWLLAWLWDEIQATPRDGLAPPSPA